MVKKNKILEICILLVMFFNISFLALADDDDDDLSSSVNVKMTGYYPGNLSVKVKGPIDFGNLAKYQTGTYKKTEIEISDTSLINFYDKGEIELEAPERAILTNGHTKLIVYPGFIKNNEFGNEYEIDLDNMKNKITVPVYAKINTLKNLTPGVYGGSFTVTIEYDI